MKCSIQPMPDWCRTVPRRLWPCHPPIFMDIKPGEKITEKDIQYAYELFQLLDDHSKEYWDPYGKLFENLRKKFVDQ